MKMIGYTLTRKKGKYEVKIFGNNYKMRFRGTREECLRTLFIYQTYSFIETNYESTGIDFEEKIKKLRRAK